MIYIIIGLCIVGTILIVYLVSKFKDFDLYEFKVATDNETTSLQNRINELEVVLKNVELGKVKERLRIAIESGEQKLIYELESQVALIKETLGLEEGVEDETE